MKSRAILIKITVLICLLNDRSFLFVCFCENPKRFLMDKNKVVHSLVFVDRAFNKFAKCDIYGIVYIQPSYTQGTRGTLKDVH